MIRVEGLAIRRGDTPVIRGYDFLIDQGSTVAILGSNGVGKTSLLDVIAGLLRQSEGKVTRDAHVGYVPQLFDVAFDYSVMDIVLMGRARHIRLFGSPGVADYRAAHASMQRLGIEHFAERSFNTLSGGQRQLTIIAQALTSECDILILDEPCSALDYRNQATVITMLDRLRIEHGLTILFTSHSPQHAMEIATHVLLMYGDQDYAFGTAEALLTEDNLSRLYGVRVKRADFSEGSRHTFAPVYSSRAQLRTCLSGATGRERGSAWG
jgi:iron complex transport system ATP-binding protein